LSSPISSRGDSYDDEHKRSVVKTHSKLAGT
jgi:hypothetical protein